MSQLPSWPVQICQSAAPPTFAQHSTKRPIHNAIPLHRHCTPTQIIRCLIAFVQVRDVVCAAVRYHEGARTTPLLSDGAEVARHHDGRSARQDPGTASRRALRRHLGLLRRESLADCRRQLSRLPQLSLGGGGCHQSRRASREF